MARHNDSIPRSVFLEKLYDYINAVYGKPLTS